MQYVNRARIRMEYDIKFPRSCVPHGKRNRKEGKSGEGGDKNNLESGDQMREMNICRFIPLKRRWKYLRESATRISSVVFLIRLYVE